MRHRTLAASVVGVAVLFAACGGDPREPPPCGGSPTAASCPSPTIKITASTDLLKTRSSFAFAGTATHYDGTVVPVSTWTSDNPSVAAVDDAGRVTGTGPGLASIVAEHDEARAAVKLRVVPDFEGRWDGDYTTTACHHSGAFVGFCDQYPVGSILPFAVQLTQSRDAADGTFTLGGLVVRVHGTVADGGTLALADATLGVDGIVVELEAAVLSLNASDELQGVFRTLWTCPGSSGDAGFNGQLRMVSRVDAAAGRPLAHWTLARTWRDAGPIVTAR